MAEQKMDLWVAYQGPSTFKIWRVAGALEEAQESARKAMIGHVVARRLRRGAAAELRDGKMLLGRVVYRGWRESNEEGRALEPWFIWEPVVAGVGERRTLFTEES